MMRAHVALRLDGVEHALQHLVVLVEADDAALPRAAPRMLDGFVQQAFVERYQAERVLLVS